MSICEYLSCLENDCEYPDDVVNDRFSDCSSSNYHGLHGDASISPRLTFVSHQWRFTNYFTIKHWFKFIFE